MNSTETADWLELNQHCLTAEVAKIRKLLEQHVAHSQDESHTGIETTIWGDDLIEPMEMATPTALDTLCQLFGLSIFERSLLLLCAGVELDSTLATLCATVQENWHRTYPTFGLALAILPEAHWSALSTIGNLRYWRMIDVGNGENLVSSPLKIDERILHYLTGIQYIDERLKGFVRSMPVFPDLVPSHHELATKAANSWQKTVERGHLPILQLYGADNTSQRAIAMTSCSMMGFNLYMMPAQVIPIDTRELDALMHLWEREAILMHSALLLDCADIDRNDHVRENSISRFIEESHAAIILTGQELRPVRERQSINWEVHRPTSDEQRTIWHEALKFKDIDGQVEALVSQFDLNVSTLHSMCDEALMHSINHNGDIDFSTILWETCRQQARPRLDELTQRIDSTVCWDDLVLPEMQKQLLLEIAAHVRQRLKVYKTWGFGKRSSRGLGISALFVGSSGTGKTLAAEVIANELHLDLYRIDLSQVVSKYIGETEKNLRRVFDAAEGSGSILLFDEADALFGKRSEVKDSHDRYANIEVSYLLQRMEDYRGLAILTTNMKEALDTAFLRRIRFVVRFPFPSVEQRTEIWRCIFPQETPTEGLDAGKLARLNVSGGNIRNIAIHAAFQAADAGEPVRMTHLLRAARVEYNKIEKALTDDEIRGWV